MCIATHTARALLLHQASVWIESIRAERTPRSAPPPLALILQSLDEKTKKKAARLVGGLLYGLSHVAALTVTLLRVYPRN